MRRCELFYCIAQLRCDSGDARLVGAAGVKVARASNDQLHFAGARHAMAFRPGAKRAVEITGQHRHIATGDERANARLEFLEPTIARARAFGENDQDVAGFREQITAKRHALPHLRIAREWQRVDDYRCDPGARHALEKVIGRGGWERAMQPAER